VHIELVVTTIVVRTVRGVITGRIHGTISGMQTTIDRAGRIVVPKSLRDELHLEGGTALEIRVNNGRLEIEPLPTPMRLVRRGKGLVATTEKHLPPIDADDVRAVVESLRR
jgi:AbrB family looped-hinge helix DNA binding protein